LWKDAGSGSLQVVDELGEWRDVVPEAGCFIINIGDLVARWTNDRWVSTLHRVVVPPRDEQRLERRLSIPFFYKPNYDAAIGTIATCIDAEHLARYDRVVAGEHLAMKRGKHVVK
jgi:isopenicillin N synthase-like dioxygenase